MKVSKRKMLVMVVGVVVIGYLLVAGPGTDDVNVQDELFSRYRLLVKYRSMAEQYGDLGSLAADLDDELISYEERFMTSPGPALASAELQRVVSDMAEGVGLSLQTVKPMPPLERGDFVQVPLLFEFRGRIASMRDFIRKIEQARLGLYVSKLTVSVANVREPETLNIKIAVHGIMRL